MDSQELAKYLDLANHHADAGPEDVRSLCGKVKKYGFNSAFVNGVYVPLAVDLLQGKARVGTVISFPLGQDSKAVKAVATIDAAKNGADELDVSMNVGLFKAGEKQQVLDEMRSVIDAGKGVKKTLIIKFIIETGYLSERETRAAAELVVSAGADFVKTCSGFGPRGAELKDVELIRQAIGQKARVKVAGGIHTREEALAFIEKGADRIGTSKAVEIISEK